MGGAEMEDSTSTPALPPLPTIVNETVAPPAPVLSAPTASGTPAAVAPSVAISAAAPAIREDQVQNAVGFLSHPQVRTSTNTASKRSFLERKGLTAPEIDEAFRRVPEQPAPVAPAPAPAPPAAPQPAAYAAQQAQLPQQPYAAPAPAPATQLVAAQPAAPVALVPGYRWSQLVLGVGAVVAAGWALHQLVLPRLRSVVDSWQTQRREAEEARHKELTEAVSSLKGCQEELKVSTQALLEAVTLMREQQRGTAIMDGAASGRGPATGRPTGAPPRDSYYSGMNSRNDMPYGGSGNASSMLGADNYAALRAAAGYTNAYPPDPPSYTVSYPYGRGDSTPATAGPTGGDGSRSGAGVYGMQNPPYGPVRTAAANPYGGGPGQQGSQQPENLPYRVTAPPSPAHSTHSLQSGRQPQHPPSGGLGSASGPYGSSDRLYDPSMAGGGAKPPGGSGSGGGAAAAGAGADGRTVPRPPPEQPAYPQSFHEVMEMVQQGITPPNVRTDINDAPPDPTQPLSEPRLQAPRKPWERAAGGPLGANGSAGTGGGGGAGGLTAAHGSSYGIATPLNLPPTSYGMPSVTPSGSAAAAGGSTTAGVGASGSGGATGHVSSSGAASGGPGLTVLPPANPTWRPPPPPARTVVASNPPSPPSSSSLTGMANGGAAAGGSEAGPSGAAAAPAAAASAAPAAVAMPVAMPAAAHPQLAAEVPEPLATLAGPPSPSPSQPAFAASVTELTRTPDGPGPSAFSAAAAPSSPPPPPPPPAVAVDEAGVAAAGESAAAMDVGTPPGSSAPGTSTP